MCISALVMDLHENNEQTAQVQGPILLAYHGGAHHVKVV